MFGVKNMIQYWFCFDENRVVWPLSSFSPVPLFCLERIIRHNLALIKLSLHQVTICLAKMTQKQTDYDGSQRKNLKYTQRNGSQIFRRRTLTKKLLLINPSRKSFTKKRLCYDLNGHSATKILKFFYAKFLVESLIDEFWSFFSFVWTTGC